MPETNVRSITGIYVSLKHHLVRLVFRRRIHSRCDVYEVYKPANKIKAVAQVIETLSKEIPNFSSQLLKIDEESYQLNSHRVRRYIHTERSQLYRREDLEHRSQKIGDLWLATDLSSDVMLQVIKEACRAAQVEYGSLDSIKW